jgi:hypothetical protein
VRVPVVVTCRVLGVSRQAYYQWLSEPVSQRDWDDAHLINAALEIHADDPADGYRFIADELAQRGFVASENRVWRVCSMQEIFSSHAKKKGLYRKAGPPVHDDLVDRDFTADAPNVKWLTDITEHPTGEGKIYLCGGEGLLLQQDRRLLHRRPHEILTRGRGPAQRHRAAEPVRGGCALRPRQPIPVRALPAPAA